MAILHNIEEYYNRDFKKGNPLNREGLPRTYTTKQLAEMFRFHVNTIRFHIQKGNIKTVKIGRRYLILEDEVNRLLEEGWERSRSKRPKPKE